MPPIQHDAADRRFYVRLPEGEAYLSYEEVGDGTLDLRHTIVPGPAQGRGVGDSLVRAALDYAREQGARIVPSCPFVQAWLDDHPDEQDLVARAA